MSKEKIRQVRTRDQQHEADSGCQHEQSRPRLRDQRAVQLANRHSLVGVVLRIFTLEACGDRTELGICLFDRMARAQPSDSSDEMPTAIRLRRFESIRDENIGLALRVDFDMSEAAR